eukprot:scaffold43762_cov40-Phaeocystis_antarctica.AAC.1
MRTPPCTVRAHSGLTARHVIDRRAAGRLADQMSSPGDHLPVRVGPAFGIAPCGELAAKEFGGVGATRYYKVRVQNGLLHVNCSKNSLRGLGEKAFHWGRGGWCGRRGGAARAARARIGRVGGVKGSAGRLDSA